jgi:glutathione synthase/RimK-type ligase-like ATP-grasp enzyme
MTALLWGLPGDTTLSAVHAELVRLGVPLFFLDQRLVLDTTVELSVGATVEGALRIGDAAVDLAAVGAAYLRPHDGTRVAAVRDDPPDSAAWRHAEEVGDVLSAWSELTTTYVVNRPSASAGNGSKPAQLRDIAAAGFAVPETLVTNDPAAVAEFADRHDGVIYKSTSGVRSRVRGLAEEMRLGDVRTCPTQFQRKVAGTDVRVHVVGAEIFATRIRSEADDYRYAGRQGLPRPLLAAIDLPDDVADRCRLLAARIGLAVAGIDLRVTPEGEWFCFEVNPSPAFCYYESATGQPIATAVAGLLAAAVTCSQAIR